MQGENGVKRATRVGGGCLLVVTTKTFEGTKEVVGPLGSPSVWQIHVQGGHQFLQVPVGLLLQAALLSALAKMEDSRRPLLITSCVDLANDNTETLSTLQKINR